MENLLIAKVSKPQGIKGELKCQLFTDVLVAVTKAKKVIRVSKVQKVTKVTHLALRRFISLLAK